MGYRYDPEALKRVADGMRSATASIDEGLAAGPPVVDAGRSTDFVNATITSLRSVGVVLAEFFEDMGEKIDAAKGGYDGIENTKEGELELIERHLDESLSGSGFGSLRSPLKNAPDRTTETDPTP